MRVLIIEDEAQLREQLAARLRAEGYAVDAAANGRDGAYLGAEYPIDVAVVDLGLPDQPGTEVIKGWRARGLKFPILILTARGRWEDKVAGLEIGADDYLVKPFQSEELVARLRALVRRAAGWTDSKLRCGPFVLNTAAKELAVDGAPVEITAFEYKVLEYLMLHSGRVVSKSELTDHLYEDDADRDSNVLEVIIGRLRRKLDPARILNPVETARGQGYRFRFERSASQDGAR
ncbi:MAG: response regulator transcription factor [Gammaproteobacteria bacterium]|nr:response regulator transcription factor [Gammaproteobacteria bacterium]MBI5619008.1 response regulator transcription factor [Gammaproteobacteria bacterium]